MRLIETPEQIALRHELRSYFERAVTPDAPDAPGDADAQSPSYRSWVRQLGADGWLGIGWPVEYGGQGRPATDQFIFFDEVQRAGVPFPFVTINTVGPTIMQFGSDEQKRDFLPGIVRGEIEFAIGYTEPEAGTDLASLRTRAVRDGDEYVINGSKVFTSGADQADYVWLACRTDPEAPKHKGISILLVPTSSPGFSCTPIATVGGDTTSASFYDDVRVPVTNVVGDVNAGWSMITNQLNHERVGLAGFGGRAQQAYDDVVEWATGNRLIDVPWVQMDLGRCLALLEAMRLLNWKLAVAASDGALTAAESSVVKVYGTETCVEVYRRLLGVVGAGGYLQAGSPGAVLAGRLERAARVAQINTFGGGVNEVQRDIIAVAGLHMARQAR